MGSFLLSATSLVSKKASIVWLGLVLLAASAVFGFSLLLYLTRGGGGIVCGLDRWMDERMVSAVTCKPRGHVRWRGHRRPGGKKELLRPRQCPSPTCQEAAEEEEHLPPLLLGSRLHKPTLYLQQPTSLPDATCTKLNLLHLIHHLAAMECCV